MFVHNILRIQKIRSFASIITHEFPRTTIIPMDSFSLYIIYNKLFTWIHSFTIFFYVNFLVYPALLVPIDSSRTIFINGSKPRKTPSTVIPVGSLTRTFLSMNFLSSGGWAAAMLISFTRKNKLLFPRIKNWLEITWMKWMIKNQKRFVCLLLLLWYSAEFSEFMLDHTVTLAM